MSESSLVERLRDVVSRMDSRDWYAATVLMSEAATAIELAQTEIKGHMRVEEELKARIKKLEWDHYDAWAPMFNRLMMVCHRLAKGLPIRLEEVQGWGNEHPAPQAQARIAELEKLFTGWDGYCWKDGKYIDDVQEFFDAALKSRMIFSTKETQ